VRRDLEQVIAGQALIVKRSRRHPSTAVSPKTILQRACAGDHEDGRHEKHEDP
jgi:hypothetical protein